MTPRFVWLVPWLFLALLACSLARPSQGEPALGIAAKKPVLGAACKVCPWGALAEVVQTALRPYGYEVQICYTCARADAPRIVAGAKLPPPYRGGIPGVILDSDAPPPPQAPVEFGITSVSNVWWAYEGTHQYAGEEPRKNLRLIATIQSPNYLIVAARTELGITDLAQVREKRWPVRILVDNNSGPAVLEHYGLGKEAVEAAGGHVGSGSDPSERASFDVIVHGGTLANPPEFNIWYEVSQKFDLSYLRLPDALLEKLVAEFQLERQNIPNGLLRGIHEPIPTVARSGHAIYGRTDTPDDFAYVVAKAMDEQQGLLQWTMLNFSYNPRTVVRAHGLPLHPGAERYYREKGYLK
jgi:uncharacterized protein